jgi:hypothetical protein
LKLTRVFFAALLFTACSKPDPNPNSQVTPPPVPPPAQQPPPSTPSGYDLEANGLPLFVTANYIDLSRILKISRFRSGEGHDYADNFEKCRSMKHYFQPVFGTDWSTIKIFAPFAGTIVKVEDEWAGKQVHIVPDGLPFFKVIMFHVNLNSSLKADSKVSAGQQIGTHISTQTISDVTIGIETTKGWKLVSPFEVMSDDVFNLYKARGISSRSQAIITKAERDASPLSCSGETFANKGTIENRISPRSRNGPALLCVA